MLKGFVVDSKEKYVNPYKKDFNWFKWTRNRFYFYLL